MSLIVAQIYEPYRAFPSEDTRPLDARVKDIHIAHDHRGDINALLRDVADKCPNLESLVILDCCTVTHASLAAVESGCPLLKRMVLRGLCLGICESYTLIECGFRNLERLHLCAADEDILDAVAIKRIREANPQRTTYATFRRACVYRSPDGSATD